MCGLAVLCLTAPGEVKAAWTEVTIPGGAQRPQDVAYFNGMFVAVGYDAEIITSSDGASWTLQTVDAQPADPNNPDFLPAFRSMSSSGSLLVAVGDRGIIATSANGTDWTVTQQGSQAADGYQSITYGGGKFVATRFGNYVSVSTDGSSWQDAVVTESTVFLRAIAYFNGTFYTNTGFGNTAYSSVDGTNWTEFASGLFFFGSYYSLNVAGDFLYVGGSLSNGPGLAYRVESEPRYNNIDLATSAQGSNIFDVAYGDGVTAAVGGIFGQTSYLFTSDDGTSFESSPSGFSNVATGIAYGGGLWVIVGEGYAAYTDNLSGGGNDAPDLIDGGTDLGDGWYSTWIGTVNVNNWPWIYGKAGWFYDSNTGPGGWFYFTNASLQCWVYSSESSPNWFYMEPIGKPKGWWYISRSATDGFTYFLGPDDTFVAVRNRF